MALTAVSQPVPLATDLDGVARVGSSRVPLDTVVAAFREGMTPEGIVEQYPSLRLADVYSVIGYLLSCPGDIEAYLQDRRQHADDVRRDNEAQFDPTGIRDRLLSRRGRK